MDRLGWAVGFSAACYGVRIGLRATSAEGLAELQSGLPRALKPSRALDVDILYSLVVGGPGKRAGERHFHVLYRDAARLARSLDIAEIRRAFDRDLSIAIGDAARRRVFVHAGVVGMNGGAILIPGKSCSGKTTLVRRSLRKEGSITLTTTPFSMAVGASFPGPSRSPCGPGW